MNPRIKKPGADAAHHWNIEAIVTDLRRLRIEAHEKRAGPVKLPSRKALIGIIEGFSAALFRTASASATSAARASTSMSGTRSMSR